MGFVINLKAETGLVDRSENTTRFYKDIKGYKPLTREEEIEWFTKLKEGSPSEKKKAREHLILCNQRLVIAAAKNYATTETLTDYINEANFGLFEAIDKFDITKGTKFASYAMWFILRAINKYKYDTSQMISKTNYSKTFHVMSKLKNKFIQENEREATNDELLLIMKEMYPNKDIKDKNDLLDMRIESIDAETDDDDSFHEVADYNRVTASYNESERNAQSDFNKTLVSSLLNILTPREQEIIKMRFGMYSDNGLCREFELIEIGEKLGLTSERVRQLEISALKKLKDEYANRVSKML